MGINYHECDLTLHLYYINAIVINNKVYQNSIVFAD